MNSNVQAVVTDIETRIASLNGLREALLKFDEETLPIVQSTGRVENNGAPRQQRPTKKQKRGGQVASSKIQNPSSRAEAAPAATRVNQGSTESRPTMLTGKPQTMAGAMKREIARLGGREFTSDELRSVIEKNYEQEEWFKNTGPSALSGNLSYWAKNARLEKTANGYRALDAEFFANVEY